MTVPVSQLEQDFYSLSLSSKVLFMYTQVLLTTYQAFYLMNLILHIIVYSFLY